MQEWVMAVKTNGEDSLPLTNCPRALIRVLLYSLFRPRTQPTSVTLRHSFHFISFLH